MRAVVGAMVVAAAKVKFRLDVVPVRAVGLSGEETIITNSRPGSRPNNNTLYTRCKKNRDIYLGVVRVRVCVVSIVAKACRTSPEVVSVPSHRRLGDAGSFGSSFQALNGALAVAESLGSEAERVPQAAPIRRWCGASPGPKHLGTTPGSPAVDSNSPPFLGGTHTHLYLCYSSNDSPRF